MHNHYRRFILIVLFPVLLLLPAGAGNWKFLRAAGELTPIEDVVEAQQISGGLYGTALHPNVYPYKMELYAARNPKIVVIGSSRVLQFRQSQFDQPFVNLGRTINYPAEAVKLVQDMLALGAPRMVLFGIDHYWFNPAYTNALDFRTHRLRGGHLTPNALMKPFRWLLDKKVTISTYREFLFDRVPRAANGAPLFGVLAILEGSGFGADGSRYYDNQVYGRRGAEDPAFQDTLGRIASGRSQFRHGESIDAQRFKHIQRSINLLTDAGVEVITFVPPMASPVTDAMAARANDYKYADIARTHLGKLGARHFDFLEISSLNASDCEFIDGFHGGDVVAARILKKMAKPQDTNLANFVDHSNLERTIRNFAGHALADRTYQRLDEREIDFLALGCTKSR
jgi:hypothetical protein